jgi:S-adenosylmethionine:tRNA ribosyltransferase-isomerase
MIRAASRPPEERGLSRDGVRLLVATTDGLAHATFSHLPRFLTAGDLLVVNTTGTIAAAVDGLRADGRAVAAHLSTPLDDGTWLVELRETAASHARVTDAAPGEVISLPAGASITLLHHYPDVPAARMWVTRVRVRSEPDIADGDADAAIGARGATGPRGTMAAVSGAVAGASGAVEAYLARNGRPIRYSYVPDPWPLSAYQTVFARAAGAGLAGSAGLAGAAGSAEMASAGRPITADLVIELITSGIVVAPVTLHAGVASLEAGEPPLPERFSVPESTARLVNLALATGRRVVAVGTTVTRALESAAGPDGTMHARRGWTDLVLGAAHPARVVSGLVTGWHDPEASHLALLEAVAGPELVRAAYAAAERAGYLWHEFGDSCLLLPPIHQRKPGAVAVSRY